MSVMSIACCNGIIRPLRDSVIFGERLDLAILSGPLAIQRAKRF